MAQLRAVYEEWRLRGSNSSEWASLFYPPLLVSEPPHWDASTHRVAVVGQETLGWSWTRNEKEKLGYKWTRPDLTTLADFFACSDGVDAMLEAYEMFDFAAHQPISHRSPFWRYFRAIKDAIESSGQRTSAVFTNVMRSAANGKTGFTVFGVREHYRSQYLRWQRGLLVAELQALRPTLVLFVSGPNYDTFLNTEFRDLGYEPLAAFSVRQVARLKSGGLPSPAYRTYHPGFLHRSLRFSPLAAAIADYEQILR